MSNVSTDPIADMLTRIRNAIAVQKSAVVLPHSKSKSTVADVLVKANFLDGVDVVSEETKQKLLRITINRDGDNARITHIERISKPGRRVYAQVDQIPVVKNGRGIVVISTSKGVMTGDEARAQKLGGELICKVY